MLAWTWWTPPYHTSCCPSEILFAGQVGGTIVRHSYYLSFFVGPLLHAFKLWGWVESESIWWSIYGGARVYVVAHEILVSAQGPLVFG